MAIETLSIEIKPGYSLSIEEHKAIAVLFRQAFDEDYGPYQDAFKDPIHILGKIEDRLISHALWITRWLQLEGHLLLRTAYIEAVATDSAYRRRGYATVIMQTLAEQIQDYNLGALSPAETSLYSRLGWEFWHGPLYARRDGKWVFVKDEKAMILRTSKTPPLDLQLPLSIEWRPGEVW